MSTSGKLTLWEQPDVVVEDVTGILRGDTVAEIEKVQVIPKNCMLDYKIPDSYMPGY